MTAQRPLVLCAKEQTAEKLVLYSQVKILSRRIAHVDVHSSDGNGAQCTWQCVRYVRSTDGSRVRVEDGVPYVSFEIGQSIERRIPCTVRPDVVKNAVIKDTVTASDCRRAFTKRIPSKANARAEVFVVGVPHPADRGCARTGDAGNVVRPITTGEVGELRDNPMGL